MSSFYGDYMRLAQMGLQQRALDPYQNMAAAKQQQQMEAQARAINAAARVQEQSNLLLLLEDMQ